MNNSPLVSIVIVTYNSSNFIVETLDSVASQTYNNIELIVSDDCSSDNTVQLCQEWMSLHKERFVKCDIVTTPINTGTSINCNRGANASSGKWLKMLAGDDVLMPEAIEKLLLFTENNKCNFCCCNLQPFGDDPHILDTVIKYYCKLIPLIKLPQKKQLKEAYRLFFAFSPGYFYTKSLFDEVGGLDEKYPFADEWPFFINTLEKGYKLYFDEEILVKYRVHPQSLSKNGKMNVRLFSDNARYFYDKREKEMIKNGLFLSAWHQKLYYYTQRFAYKYGRTSLRYRVVRLIMLLSPQSLWQ